MPHFSSYALQCVWSWRYSYLFIYFYFFLQQYAETSLLESCTSTKTPTSTGDFLSQYFPGFPRSWTRGAGVSSQVTSCSTTASKVCMSITWNTGMWDSCQDPLKHGARFHISHQGPFVHGWMPSICWGGDLD